MSFGSVDAICRIAGLSNKPICLKEHFGIVGESGWLLTFNPIYDTEMCSPGQKSGTVQLSGHFYQILRDKAWDVLIQAKVIVQNLDLKLEESDIKKFSKKPKQFLSYLDSRTSHAPLKEQAIESIDEFRKSLNHYQAIADMLSRLFPSTVRLADFIVSPNLCYCYFVYEVSQNDNDLESLENFNRLLENVKTLPPLPNTKYNQLDNIKTDILNAETPRQVLKVDPSASEEECIKAYRSLARQTHPDKILEEPWREQANALFKVIAAAYAHIKVPQTEIQ
jgi:DnaJ-domain-containing protein 1